MACEGNQLFAEHLSYANVINLTVALTTPRDGSTSLQPATDGTRRLRLVHGAESATIELSIDLPQDTDFGSCLPAPGSTTKVSRLQSSTSVAHPIQSRDIDIPWTATSLPRHLALNCAATVDRPPLSSLCTTTLLRRDRVEEWRDLPSEGWAEMMDLWHCHKPDEKTTHNHTVNGKGYAAANTQIARPGLGFVDALTFLVASEDCENVQVDDTERVSCAGCGRIVGRVDHGIRLYKPLLSLEIANPPHSQIAPEMWLSSFLQSKDVGPKRFISARRLLEIWLFSPRLTYSNSRCTSSDPRVGMKVLFRSISADDVPKDNELLTRTSLQKEELGIPVDMEDYLLDQLEVQHNLLPSAVRWFQDWKAALLPLFIAG